MAKNMGFDLGTTNSVIAVYDEVEQRPKAIEVNSSTNIPSVAWRDDGDWEFGKGAKDNAGEEEGQSYREFKVLITEDDQKKLSRRGYSTSYTPVDITKKFTDFCLKSGACAEFGAEQIDHLVICAPEVWNAGARSSDGRPILREICQSLGYVGDVRVVSEPSAAGAYFAHRYARESGEPYRGRILIIDYGGGTLDITLIKVNAVPDGEQLKMEIKVEKRTGAGQHENEVGEAGVAYQEALIRCVALRYGIEAAEGPDFFCAVDKLETHLRSKVSDIEQTFTFTPPDELDALDEIPFCWVKYGSTRMNITYGDLTRTYDQVIRPVLAAQLEKINREMDNGGIDYTTDDKTFRIELAGGFGNFYLVRNQVSNVYEALYGQIENSNDRERAVAYGASLVASDVVNLRSTAPYSIGVRCSLRTNMENTHFAFKYGEDIEYKKQYFQCFGDGGRMPLTINNNEALELIINYGADPNYIQAGQIVDSIKKKLQALVPNGESIHVAFSLDESEILSFHIQKCDYLYRPVGEVETIRLSRIGDLLKNSEAEYIRQH